MKYCNRVFDSLYCMPNGDVSFCGWMNATIGNILETDLENIWNGEMAEYVRESIKDGSFRYCRKVSCPHCENDSLPEMTQEELNAQQPKSMPDYYEVANDIICNHSCPSCRDHVFSVSEDYKNNLRKQLEILKPYLEQSDRISLNGAGEVFASPIMMEMLETLQPQKQDFSISIQTNGSLFNRKNWNRICHLAKYYTKVIVTPNSFIKENYEHISGHHNNYDKMLENMYFLKELREKEDINYLIISIVVQDRNFWELPDFIEKAINEFGADEVIVKPLYKWFYMSEETYWFKDVLNPKHPYHKEWLQILEHPILDNPKVYMFGAKNLHEEKVHPAYKYKELLRIAKEFVSIQNVGNRIAEVILRKTGKKEIILYGDNELTDILCSLMKDTEICIKCILARDICNTCIQKTGVTVKKLSEYNLLKDDVIVITNYYDRNYIERDLSLKRYTGKVMDVKEILYLIMDR